MIYPRVFVAGTFDGLHKGHAFILTRAFKLGKNVTIGLTSDLFIKKFKISNFKLKIRDYESRKKDLTEWLKKKHLSAEIVPIDDPYEPAVSYKESVVLLVTPDNKQRGEKINSMRQKRGLPVFTLVEIPLITAEDDIPISSTRVRRGEIDTEGRFILPDNLRPELQKPLGKIIKTVLRRKDDYVITVGDVATKTLLDAGITPALIIIDNKVERKPYKGLAKWKKTLFAHPHYVQSGPGFIAHEAISFIKQWSRPLPLKVAPLKGKRSAFVLEVDGEEDLLALPAAIHAPLGAILYYGQPGIGLVEILITKDVKRWAKKLLNRFFVKYEPPQKDQQY